ncbi:MAG TPA: hypothetical protein EYH38_03910 [Leucothrix sp.]|nr:hypothetical protein [Leucothrix sp.]
MTYPIKVTVAITLLSTLVGCSANNNFALDEAQASALRNNTARLQQQDRNRDHIERMRRADAIARATRHTKGDITYSPTSTSTRTTVIVPK